MITYKSVESVTATSFEQADAIASRLAARKDTWARLGIQERITYLTRCIEGVQAVAASWMEASCRAKGIDPTATLAGEEWMAALTPTVRYLRLLIETLEADGQPQPVSWYTRPDGQVVAQVFPSNQMEQRIWAGFTAEVWIEPDQPATQGAIYQENNQTGSIALVLGSGNNASSSPTDILYKMFVENQVVILKMSPASEHDGPFIEQAFQSLIEDGFFGVVYGGAELGNYLCHHPEINTVHITGSQHTHDLIVWGNTPEEQVQRKATHEPLLSKPITSRLGCITPVLVVPGSWSKADLSFQARQVASMVTHNASFNCDAAKVVVTAKGWKQREAFLDQLHKELATIPARKAYYPGAKERYQAFLDHYPQAKPLIRANEDSIPWTVIPEVSPEPGEYALTQEAFCGVLAEVTLLLRSPSQSAIGDDQLPKAAVILCLRGADPFLADCVRALLNQNYPHYKLQIVVDSCEDQAWKIVNEAIAQYLTTNCSASTQTTDIQVSPLRIKYETCSLRCSASFQAISELDDSYDVVALVDADVIAHPDWLRELVAPLADKRVGATTGYRWYMPQTQQWGSLVRYLWNSVSAVAVYFYKYTWGGSMASNSLSGGDRS